jgi:hypothetical protein
LKLETLKLGISETLFGPAAKAVEQESPGRNRLLQNSFLAPDVERVTPQPRSGGIR